MVACSIGRQVLYGRSRPLTAPGNGSCGFWPKPTCGVHAPTSRAAASACAILTVPTLLDFWITSSTVSMPCGCASLMVEPPMVRRPGAVWISGLRRDQARFQRQRDDERLHRRAGLEGVGQRAVAQLRAGEVLALVGLVARVVGQRQHFAGLRVEHHHAAGLGLVLDHRVAQLLVGEELHLAVDRQLQVACRPPAAPARPRPRRCGPAGP